MHLNSNSVVRTSSLAARRPAHAKILAIVRVSNHVSNPCRQATQEPALSVSEQLQDEESNVPASAPSLARQEQPKEKKGALKNGVLPFGLKLSELNRKSAATKEQLRSRMVLGEQEVSIDM